MATLLDSRTEPPGGWTYVQPQTGCRMRDDSLGLLVHKVIQHRVYKGILPHDPETVMLEVQRQICQGQEPRFCRAEEGEDYRPTADRSRDLTASKALSFSAGAIEFLNGRGEMVGQEEAKRRANICRGCPLNREVGACACTPFWVLINRLVPTARVEPGLAVCAACGCSLKAKVLMPDAVVAASNQGQGINFPAWCWQKEIS